MYLTTKIEQGKKFEKNSFSSLNNEYTQVLSIIIKSQAGYIYVNIYFLRIN